MFVAFLPEGLGIYATSIGRDVTFGIVDGIRCIVTLTQKHKRENSN
jgi:hypothetical protein